MAFWIRRRSACPSPQEYAKNSDFWRAAYRQHIDEQFELISSLVHDAMDESLREGIEARVMMFMTSDLKDIMRHSEQVLPKSYHEELKKRVCELRIIDDSYRNKDRGPPLL